MRTGLQSAWPAAAAAAAAAEAAVAVAVADAAHWPSAESCCCSPAPAALHVGPRPAERRPGSTGRGVTDRLCCRARSTAAAPRLEGEGGCEVGSTKR